MFGFHLTVVLSQVIPTHFTMCRQQQAPFRFESKKLAVLDFKESKYVENFKAT